MLLCHVLIHILRIRHVLGRRCVVRYVLGLRYVIRRSVKRATGFTRFALQWEEEEEDEEEAGNKMYISNTGSMQYLYSTCTYKQTNGQLCL